MIIRNNSIEVDADIVSVGEFAKLANISSDQTIDGIKTFSSSPIVPTPTTDIHVANKGYVDNVASRGTDYYIGSYGIEWNETHDTYRRVGSANYTAIQSLMKRCVLNADGTVNYYLDKYNSNFKEDGTPSVLDGTDGNVMVEIPKTYMKYTYDTTDGVKHRWEISLTPDPGYEVHWAHMHPTEKEFRYYPAYLGYSSGGKLISRSGVYPTVSQTIAQFRTLAVANGTGWHQIDFALYELITLFAIIEYGTMNIQATLGQGRTALTGGTWVNGSYIGINGLSNNVGNGTANYTYAGDADDASADMSFMSYRGCENFFGNVWRFADGINCRGAGGAAVANKEIWLNSNPATYASDVFSGDYVREGTFTTSATNGYARTLANSKKGMFPISVSGGSSTVGTTDYYYTSTTTNTIALVGGTAGGGLSAGPLYLGVGDAASLADAVVGAGVSR